MPKDKSSYFSKYAFSGIVFCGECGSPYRRLTWTPHGKKRYVWRCRKRVSKGVDNCQSRTVHEEVLQDAVVQAIKQTICNPEAEYTAIERKVLENLSTGHEAELMQIEEELKDLQDKVVKNVNNNDEFDSLVDKIEQLRNRKEELTREQAQDHRNAECITELKETIEAGKDEAFSYSNKLVRDFIEKIEVFPNTLRVTLKAGVSTMVKM
ncbi:MAG: recombinase zinc beta ribbon domain-containing protein [Mogibacterium diversum]|nr:recombinase zinc beta ribbon domain-containing protein [Mogibacterium diversum]